jgi:hypothetical protein
VGDARRVGDKRGIRAQHPPFDARRKGSESTICVPLSHASCSLFPSLRRVQFAVSGSHQPRPCVDARESTESRSGKSGRRPNEHGPQRKRGERQAASRLAASGARVEISAPPIQTSLPPLQAGRERRSPGRRGNAHSAHDPERGDCRTRGRMLETRGRWVEKE